jgi:hypothetical protein
MESYHLLICTPLIPTASYANKLSMLAEGPFRKKLKHTMKMEAEFPSETTVKVYQTTRRHIPDDSTVDSHSRESPAPRKLLGV